MTNHSKRKKRKIKESHKEENEDTTAVTIDVPELKRAMEGILNNYYGVAAMLAKDSTEGIDENLELIIDNSKKIKDMETGIPESLCERLSEVVGNIEDGATEMKGIEIEETRKKFKNLSRSMITYLKEFHGKIKGAEKIYVYYCPMVDSSWLQRDEGTRNPYYGAGMLKCGSVKEELP